MTERVPRVNEHKSHEGFEPTMEKYIEFLKEDQRAMRSGEWNYKDPNWALNQWKDLFESRNDEDLSPEGQQSKWNVLWLWYHHASQFAAKNGDLQNALLFIDKALVFKEKLGLDNHITLLLKQLYLGDIAGAKKIAESIPAKKVVNTTSGPEEVDNQEKKSANELIAYYEARSEH